MLPLLSAVLGQVAAAAAAVAAASARAVVVEAVAAGTAAAGTVAAAARVVGGWRRCSLAGADERASHGPPGFAGAWQRKGRLAGLRGTVV